ncbi:hypothetical protein [Flavobacterium sp. 25HG05S-40]|uniref:hypothetical protein n=1 Tax=Flavobacterium sp. 25HG05S-40 TaxID=3458682 RepID=UPI00404447D8
MKNIVLMSDIMGGIILFLLVVSPIAFIVGLIMIAASKEYRQLGIKIVIGAVIAFIIGFGTCFANLSIGGMH